MAEDAREAWGGHDARELVGACGLYCRLCALRARVPGQAQALRETLRKDAVEYWGPGLPGFKEFWGFLDMLTGADGGCPGCRAGGGPPDCKVRRCAAEKGLKLCVDCPGWPCLSLRFLIDSYPSFLDDSRRLREIGLEAWLAEQEERARKGFCYADVRRPAAMPGVEG